MFNSSLFLSPVVQAGMDVQRLIVKASPHTRQVRHLSRGDNQSESFLKSKETKNKNIESQFGCTVMYNDSLDDMNAIIERIKSLIERK